MFPAEADKAELAEVNWGGSTISVGNVIPASEPDVAQAVVHPGDPEQHRNDRRDRQTVE
jgi:hypothetical protein